MIWSRRANALTLQFPAIAKACELLPTGTLVDGEIVAMDSKRQVSFNTLQRHRSEASAIRFYVFDLLILRGQSMLHEPLLKRREALSDLLAPVRKKTSAIDLSQTVTASAQDMIRAITDLRLEGIIAKHQDSIYESGKRSGAWIKFKVNQGQEFVIGGIPRAILSTPSSSGIIRGTSCFTPLKFAPALCRMCGARLWPA